MQEEGKKVVAHRSITEFELEGGLNGIGSEGIEGFFGHTNDHRALCQRLGSLERD
jgi:hypothetical protein